jgi:hypothetical protein
MPETTEGQRAYAHVGNIDDRLREAQDSEFANIWLKAHAQQQRRLETLRVEMEVLGLEWIQVRPAA